MTFNVDFLEPEQNLLGGVLLNNQVYFAHMVGIVKSYHFLEDFHRAIYEEMIKRFDAGLNVDPFILSAALKDHPSLSGRNYGANEYLMGLLNSCVAVSLAKDYAQMVVENAQRYQMYLTAKQLESGSLDLKISIAETTATTERSLFEVMENGADRKHTVYGLGDAASEYIDWAEEYLKSDQVITGITSGFETIDQSLCGLNRGNLIVIAGRPGMGKTALGAKIAFNAAKVGHAALVFSLEMTAKELTGRLLFDETEIDSRDFKAKRLSERDFESLVQAQHDFKRYPLFIDDTPRISLQALVSRARAYKRSKRLDLIVVDYIQILNARGENETLKIAEITTTLKALAKELDLPVIALAQLNREAEKREDKRPQLSDLRQSGSIEQDADAVLLCYREEYYLRMKEPQEGTPEHDVWSTKMNEAKGKAEIIVGKNRHGTAETLHMGFNGRYTRFTDTP